MIIIDILLNVMLLPMIIHEVGHILLLKLYKISFCVKYSIYKIEIIYEISKSNRLQIFLITIFGSLFNGLTIIMIVVLKIDNPYLIIGNILGLCSIFFEYSQDHKTLNHLINE